MACTTCGKSRGASSRGTRGTVARGASARGTSRSAGAQNGMVLITYRGPHGNHLIGSPTKAVKYYKYGGHGDRFYVHQADVAARPDLFEMEVVVEAAPEAPKMPASVPTRIHLPTPVLVSDSGESDDAEGEEMEVEIEIEMTEEEEEEEEEDLPTDDMTRIKGVGPARAALLEGSGVTTYDRLIKIGAEEIANILEITLAAAEDILGHARRLSK